MRFVLFFLLAIFSLQHFASAQTACELERQAVEAAKDWCDTVYLTCGSPPNQYNQPAKFEAFPVLLANGKRRVDHMCYYMNCATPPEPWLNVSINPISADCAESTTPALAALDLASGGSPPVCGSIVHPHTQVVGETIPIVGADFTLNYFSNQVVGRLGSYAVTIPITQATVDSDIVGYDVTVKRLPSLSVVDTESFNDDPSQTYTYIWDGLDGTSAMTWGPEKFLVSVQQNTTGYSPVVNTEMILGSVKALRLGVGGWVPSIWRFYSVSTGRIYSPDGTFRTVTSTTDGTYLIVAEEDASLVYYFDSTGRLARTKTGLTGQLIHEFSYNGSGHLTSITESFSRVTTFTRDGSGNLTSIVAPNGKTTTVTLNGDKYLATVTNPKSEVFTITYKDAKGLLDTFTKPNTAVSTFTYDAMGNLDLDSSTNGSSVTLTRTGPDSTLETAEGRVTSYHSYSVLDADFNQSITLPDTSSISFQKIPTIDSVTAMGGSWVDRSTYEPHPRFDGQARSLNYREVPGVNANQTGFSQTVSGLNPADPFDFTSITFAATPVGTSDTTNTVYTASSKTYLTTTPEGRTTTTVIDDYERPVSTQTGGQTAVTFDYTDNLLTEIAQGARTTTFAYDGTTKYLTTITNDLSQSVSFAYDTAGRLTTQILPDMRTIAYEYDSQGNLISLTPPSRPEHEFIIGSNEQLESYEPPGLFGSPVVQTTYVWNNDKQVTQINKPGGVTLDFNYGATTGNLDSIVSTSGTMNFGYYNGFPQSVATATGVSSYIAYGYGKINSIETRDATSPGYRIMRYYRTAVASTDVPATELVDDQFSTSRTITYTYDADKALTSTGDMNLTYNIPDGNLDTTTMGSLTDEYVYNAFGEVTEYEVKYSGTTKYAYELTRDDLGRVIEKVENINGTTNTYEYVYDSSGRLEEVTKNSVLLSTYTYDDNSNRTSASIAGSAFTGTYDDQDRLTAYNVYDLAYSLNGELESKTNTLTSAVTTYATNEFGFLTQVATSSKTKNYDMDGFRQRYSVADGATVLAKYLYSPEGELVAEYNIDNELVRRYVYATKSHVPDYFIDSDDLVYRIVTDHLGSVRMVIRVDTGAIAQTMNHDEFGRVIADSNPGFTPFGFAGGLYDKDTGLVRFGAREYDPETGRWLSKDPIRFNGGDPNLFGYVMNDPVNWIDVTGLDRKSPGPVKSLPDGGGGGGAGSGRGASTPVVSGPGRASPKGPANSIYEQMEGGALSSRTFYDGKGNSFCRQDYGHGHGNIKGPHEHNYSINSLGQVDFRIYQPLDPGYPRIPTKGD